MVASLGSAQAAKYSSRHVTGVRHATGPQGTRIVIDLSDRAPYEVIRVQNPTRIAVNLRQTQLGRGVKPFEIDGGAVRRVRVNRLSWGAQIVLDLRGEATWRDFYLAPVDAMPGRIVVDVEPPRTQVARNNPARDSAGESAAGSRRVRRPLVVAIDAGHGGSDPGAIGKKGLVEKKAALDMARRVAREINAREGFKAVLTRDTDVFLDLAQRSRIAQKKGADIFVSIHLNSAPSRRARGSEVYFLSPSGARSTANKFLSNKPQAARELGLEKASSDAILHMLVDVNQQSMMERSEYLAEEIIKTLDRKGLPPARTVKQRAFIVLKSVAMPSVMVETGFLTNPKDADILSSTEGRDRIARAVADGAVSFLTKYPPERDQTDRILVHRVKKGDTLWNISRRYNTTVASIQKSNRLGRSKVIRVGQELVIRQGYETF